MITQEFLAFIHYAYTQHIKDGHNADFEVCQRRNCKRARQIERYLILTRQWLSAAFSLAAERGNVG